MVEYDVLGALRFYPDANPPNQQIWWTAVGTELTGETPVQGSKVTIRLPAPSITSSLIGPNTCRVRR